MNFGIGNYFFKLPCGGNVLFRTLYSPTMRRNLVYSYLLDFFDMLFGKGRVEIFLNGN
jgi:hypothetical protein